MADRSPVANGVLIALSVIGILLALFFLWQLTAVVVLLLIATVFATGIYPLVERLHGTEIPGVGWKVPRALAIITVVLGAIIVVAGIIVYIGSVLWTEGTQLVQDVPEYLEMLQQQVAALREDYPQIPPMEDMIPEAQEQIGQVATAAMAATTAIFGVLGGLVTFITVVVLTVYLTISKEAVRNGFLSIIPPEHADEVGETMDEAAYRMGGWLRGQLTLAAISTFAISGMMLLVGMPYPLMIGLIGGIAELVPLLGPIVAGLVAIPIALITQPGWVGIVLIIFFVLFSQVESNWLTPAIMSGQVGLSPAVTIIALLAGGTLLGLVGALLAVPVAAALQVVVKRLVVPAVREAEGRDEDGTSRSADGS